MGYHKPTELKSLKEQYNIMALVGNGFDIQVMNEYKRFPTTQYADFYDYLRLRRLNGDNPIIKNMEQLKSKGKENWSDVEYSLSELIDNNSNEIEEIKEALDDIRNAFSDYLNQTVSSDLLKKLSEDAQKNKWSNRSLSRFLEDIEDYQELRKVPFGARKENYDLYNYLFVNFNYTSLLDNYIFLDSGQFNPKPHLTVDTNFNFDTNPRKLGPEDSWDFNSSSYISTQVVHPHGYQDIPRSLLFGIGQDGSRNRRSESIAKPYWAQADVKYQHLFADTSLFIIFGCSLGETDDWWWRNIAHALVNDTEKALMLYWRNSSSDRAAEHYILEKFFQAAGVNEDETKKKKIQAQTCVIPYTDASPRVWLSTSRL